jgi:hypothetical protein
VKRLRADLIEPSATDGDVLTSGPTGAYWAAPAGGGGGSAFTQRVNLPLTSLTGWTPGAGTWTAETDRIRQAATANAVYRLHYNTRLPLAEMIAQADIRIDSSPNNVSSRGGFVFGTPAASDGTGGSEVSLLTKGSTTSATAIDVERDAVTSYGQVTLDAAIPNGTWTTFRVHKVGQHFAVYVNGTIAATVTFDVVPFWLGRFALYAYAADVSFRNLSIWTPTLP